MGSFNDLIICRENHHEISDLKEPLANELLGCLIEICFATSSGNTLTTEEAIRACGRDSLELSGWRCLACGFAQTSTRNTRALISDGAVRDAIRSGIEQGEPAQAVIQLWQGPEDSEALRRLTEELVQSGIRHTEMDGWMRPCPACGSNDTCVYRWRREGQRFIPTLDNLQLRGSMPKPDK
jgi:ribosomal protein L37E